MWTEATEVLSGCRIVIRDRDGDEKMITADCSLRLTYEMQADSCVSGGKSDDPVLDT